MKSSLPTFWKLQSKLATKVGSTIVSAIVEELKDTKKNPAQPKASVDE